MKLIRFKASNIFSLGDIDFDLNKRGLLLITGHSYDEGSSNAAGKSSVANKGIIWTLYGSLPSGIKVQDIPNRHRKGKCWGEILFEGVDKKIYKIFRQRNPHRLDLYTQDGERITSRESTITQDDIDKLLGRGFKTFCQSDMFGQGRGVQYAELSPSGQKEVLQDILPMNLLSEWTERTLHYLQGTKLALTESEKQKEVFKSTLNERIQFLSSLKKNSETWESARKAAIGDRTQEVINKEINSKNEELTSLSISISNHNKQIEEARKDQSKIKPIIENYSEIITGLQIERSKRQGELNTLENNFSLIKQGKCPVCGSHCSESHIKEYREKLESVKDLIKKHEEKILSNKEESKKYELQFSELEEKIRNNQTLIINYANKSDTISSDVRTLHVELESLNTILKQKNPNTDLISKTKSTISDVKTQFNESKKQVSTLERETDHLNFWRSTYNHTLKLALLQAACPFLDSRVAYHLKGLRNSQIKVKFLTHQKLASGGIKENCSVDVSSETGGDSFATLSGGEQQMVNFAIGLALSDLAESQIQERSGFLILDEPFSMLDDRNSESIVDYLTSNLSKTRETILLISNEDHLKNLIPNRINIVKRSGVSEIEQ